VVEECVRSERCFGCCEGIVTGCRPGDLLALYGLGDSSVEWGEPSRESRQEPPVVVHHSQEPLQGQLAVRDWDVLDGSDSLQQWTDAGRRLALAEIHHFWLAGLALLPVDGNAVGGKEPEEGAEVVNVGALAGAVDQDVIQVDKGTVQATQDPIHKALECLRRVFSTRRAYAGTPIGQKV
jgi:hypothetical protein